MINIITRISQPHARYKFSKNVHMLEIHVQAPRKIDEIHQHCILEHF